MAIYLGDDGTLDTVFHCSDCSEEFRCNYDPYDQTGDDPPEVQEQSYLDWQDMMRAEIGDDHVCRRSN